MRNGAIYFRPDTRDPRKLVETDKNYCLADFCRGVVNRKAEHSPYCSRCRSRRWKDKFPLHYSYKQLRNDAKRRQKEFSLTRDEYISFAIKTDYAKRKGKTSLSLSIDRIDNNRGYSADNIQAMTLAENSRKQFVKFYARQSENVAYEPTAEEIAEIENQMKE